MKIRVSLPLFYLLLAAPFAAAPLAAFAEDAPAMEGELEDEAKSKDCGMMGGEMMGGKAPMQHMMPKMRERLSHAGERIASLKAELGITQAQEPAWDKFAGALLAASKSAEASMEARHKQMAEHGAGSSLPEKIENHLKMAGEHSVNLQAIKAALDPLYASFNGEQKKIADKQRISPMGLM